MLPLDWVNGRLYQGTVRFNILLGANRDDVSQEEIDRACQDANVLPIKMMLTVDIRIYSITARRV
jgi:ABC-type multidrug transport system fused ATPase/permease subunit